MTDSTQDLRVVIAGGGRTGFRTAQLLNDRGHTVVVIERDADRCAAIADEYVATVIEGDATRPSILEQAGLERTDVVAGLTAQTGTNLAVCLAAERIAGDVRTVLRTEVEPPDEFEAYVDSVIFPERAGARVAANAVEANVRAVEALAGRIEVLEVTVAENAPVVGKTLAAVSLPRGSLVISDAGGDTIAGPETELHARETYVVAAEPEVTDEVRRLFRG